MHIETENEAIVAVLVAVINIDDRLSDFEIDKVANVLVCCKKFHGQDLNDTLRKVMILNANIGGVELIKLSIPYIEPNFIKTLYAMLCDILCSDGHTSTTDIQFMAVTANYLGLGEEDYLPIATAFMTRYLWNIKLE